MQAGKSTGKSSSDGRQVLGETPELGEFVYKSHTSDKADINLRSPDAIADHVGVECSKDIRMLAKNLRNQVLRIRKSPLQENSRSTR